VCSCALQLEENMALPSKAGKRRLRKKAKGASEEKQQDQVVSNALVRVGCGGDANMLQGDEDYNKESGGNVFVDF
jgi:hypothetical protein